MVEISPITIIAQMKPYSIADVPRSSVRNLFNNCIIRQKIPVCLSRTRSILLFGIKIWLRRTAGLKDFLTPLNVVAAALVDRQSRILMHRRRHDSVHGGLWEFPGGKVERGEVSEIALIRELREELGIAVAASDLEETGAASGRTADGSRGLVIRLYTCRRWAGEPVCLEGEEMDWFAPDELPGLAMPPLDYPLAEALRGALENKCG